ncbi:hypothetical protein AB4Y87_25635 [Paenarthrobacter sp. RAF54_2]|uniref:hypothetical protein n=1 Tax=Paenarthrobacter sp. RAF54_2 TaxID=3233061 RepID=UPI003F9662AD
MKTSESDQSTAAGIAFTELSNGFAACRNPATLLGGLLFDEAKHRVEDILRAS